MLFHSKILLFFVGSIISSTSAQWNSPTYNFEMFLQNNLKVYPSWLRQNNLDPSTPNPSSVLLLNDSSLFVSVVCTIRDEQMSDHASESNQLDFSVEVDTNRQQIYFTLENKGAIKFQGKYTANGTQFSRPPFSGEGNWTYTATGGLSETAVYRYNIKPNGYIDISQGRQEYSAKPLGSERRLVEFGGVLNDELESTEKGTVMQMFIQGYESRLHNIYPEHPTANHLHKYLTELFEVDFTLNLHTFIESMPIGTNIVKFDIFAENSL